MMIMPTYVHLIDLKRWFIECHIFMPKKAFDYDKTEIYKIMHVDPAINLSFLMTLSESEMSSSLCFIRSSDPKVPVAPITAPSVLMSPPTTSSNLPGLVVLSKRAWDLPNYAGLRSLKK